MFSGKCITIHLVAAARPNFMKIAPLYHALKKENWADPVIVHTGQHYDWNMSEVFFRDLGLPEPHIHLDVGSGSHAEQTGKVMIAYEGVIAERKPDLVVVVGDVNSTLACTLAAVKTRYESDGKRSGKPGIVSRPTVAHLEAGLRSFDRSMPEEINRLVTDALADYLWTPSPDGDENLLREGVRPEKIIRVGNIMIDSLEMIRSKIEEKPLYEELGVSRHGYGVVTLHRPANVDQPDTLAALCRALARIARKFPLVFPVHPRTRKNLERYTLMGRLLATGGITLIEPLNYLRFMNLVFNCRIVITDSGGIQEETTYLGIPCLTLRSSTERPITISQGTNRLCKTGEMEAQIEKLASCETGQKKKPPELWDGQTAQRVVKAIKSIPAISKKLDAC